MITLEWALEPVRGSEWSKRRPVVVVSNDGANERATALGRGVVTIVPVTSNVARVLPFQILDYGGRGWPGSRLEGASGAGAVDRCHPIGIRHRSRPE